MDCNGYLNKYIFLYIYLFIKIHANYLVCPSSGLDISRPNEFQTLIK